MKMTQIEAIEEYQVPGDIGNFDPENFKVQENGYGWEDHHPATYISGVGKIYLGMPKGFNRLGNVENMKLMIFENYEQYSRFYNLPFNIPAWKYLDKNGNTLVRGLMPRINKPFICVILGDCRDMIKCEEITQNQINEMD